MTTGPKGQVDSCRVILIFYCFRRRHRRPEARDCSTGHHQKSIVYPVSKAGIIFSDANDLRWHSENEKSLRAMKEYLLAEIMNTG